MNILELKRVISKIKEFELEEYIDDASYFLSSLNDVQISNLSNLKHCKKDYRKLLVDLDFLNSPYYLYDVNLLFRINNKELDDIIFNCIKSDIFKNSKYHKEDLKLIITAKNRTIANYLSMLATDNNSINSTYHEEDMKIIYNSNLNSSFLYKLSSNKESLDSSSHLNDMNLLKNEKLPYHLIKNMFEVANCSDSINSTYHDYDMYIMSKSSKLSNNVIRSMAILATNKTSLLSNYHMSDMALFLTIKRDDILDLLIKLMTNKISLQSNWHKYDTNFLSSLDESFDNGLITLILKCLTNIDFLNSKYHENDLNELLSAKKNYYCYDALCTLMIDNNSINSKYHINDIRIIKNSDAVISKYLLDVATNIMSLNSKYHTEDMKLINDSNNPVLSQYLSLLACNKNSLENSNHLEHMRLILNSKTEEEAKYLYKILSSNISCDKLDDIVLKITSANLFDVNKVYLDIKCKYDSNSLDNIYNRAVLYVDGDNHKEIPSKYLKKQML